LATTKARVEQIERKQAKKVVPLKRGRKS